MNVWCPTRGHQKAATFLAAPHAPSWQAGNETLDSLVVITRDYSAVNKLTVHHRLGHEMRYSSKGMELSRSLLTRMPRVCIEYAEYGVLPTPESGAQRCSLRLGKILSPSDLLHHILYLAYSSALGGISLMHGTHDTGNFHYLMFSHRRKFPSMFSTCKRNTGKRGARDPSTSRACERNTVL